MAEPAGTVNPNPMHELRTPPAVWIAVFAALSVWVAYRLGAFDLGSFLLIGLQVLGDPGAELRDLIPELLVRQFLHLGLESIDLLHPGHQALELALVLGAEYLGCDLVEQCRPSGWYGGVSLANKQA